MKSYSLVFKNYRAVWKIKPLLGGYGLVRTACGGFYLLKRNKSLFGWGILIKKTEVKYFGKQANIIEELFEFKTSEALAECLERLEYGESLEEILTPIHKPKLNHEDFKRLKELLKKGGLYAKRY